jgi:hypothetical protein
MREQLVTDPEDIQHFLDLVDPLWLLGTDDIETPAAIIVEGDETFPERILCFRCAEPTVAHLPYFVITLEGFTYTTRSI